MDLRDITKISYPPTAIIYRNFYVFYLYILNSITTKTGSH